MATIISSVGKVLNAANGKVDSLTSIAKGALCLPSILKGLPGLGKNLIGSLVGGIGAGLEAAVGEIANLVTDTIQDSIEAITGAITGVVDTVIGLVADVAAVVTAGKNFISGLKDAADDAMDFASKKENCNFAAAQLMNCIVGEALDSIKIKDVKSINDGVSSITDSVNKATGAITSTTGSINKAVNKHSQEINRAAKVIEKANIF